MSRVRKAGCAVGILLCFAAVLYVAIPVFFPGPGIPIPERCTATNGSREDIPLGEGSAVSVRWSERKGAGTGTVLLLWRGRAVDAIPLQSHTVVAAVSQGYVYLYDDKLGYILSATTGKRYPSWLELDNYRGNYTANRSTYVQQTAVITLIGPSQGIVRRTLHMHGVVGNCHILSDSVSQTQ